jgi:hypothetical protein
MKKLNQILMAAGLLALSSTASAVQIGGTIIFGGDLTFDFGTNSVDIIGDDAFVTAQGTGDFNGISGGTTAVYNDFSYDPLSVNTGTLWSVGGFSFVLNEIVTIEETTDTQGNLSLFLAGNGVFSGNGFEDTEGAWTFSADSVFGNTFAFSSVNVPEPGIALLLGIGLVGFGINRKLRKTA